MSTGSADTYLGVGGHTVCNDHTVAVAAMTGRSQAHACPDHTEWPCQRPSEP